MLNKFKNEDGFSLLEAILSIATLALLSVFILNMFLVSSKANLKAKNMDVASNSNISMLELVKACDYPMEIFILHDFKGAQFKIGSSDYGIIEKSDLMSETPVSSEIVVFQFFDKNWQPVILESPMEDPLNPDIEHKDLKIKFAQSISFAVDEKDEEIKSGMLCNISVASYDVSYEGEKKNLVKYDASVYYPIPR